MTLDIILSKRVNECKPVARGKKRKAESSSPKFQTVKNYLRLFTNRFCPKTQQNEAKIANFAKIRETTSNF